MNESYRSTQSISPLDFLSPPTPSFCIVQKTSPQQGLEKDRERKESPVKSLGGDHQPIVHHRPSTQPKKGGIKNMLRASLQPIEKKTNSQFTIQLTLNVYPAKKGRTHPLSPDFFSSPLSRAKTQNNYNAKAKVPITIARVAKPNAA